MACDETPGAIECAISYTSIFSGQSALERHGLMRFIWRFSAPRSCKTAKTVVIVTSDHGHLEQVASTHGHPKSRVPTWYFGPGAETRAERMRTPEGIFHVVAERGKEQVLGRSS